MDVDDGQFGVVRQYVLLVNGQRHLADYEPKPPFFTDPTRMYAEAKPDAVVIVTIRGTSVVQTWLVDRVPFRIRHR